MPIYAAPIEVRRICHFSVHVRENDIANPVITVVCDACSKGQDEMSGNESWTLTNLGHWMVDHLYNCARNQRPT